MKSGIIFCFFPFLLAAQNGSRLVLSDLAYHNSIDSIDYLNLELADTLQWFYGTQVTQPAFLSDVQKNAWYYSLYSRIFDSQPLSKALMEYEPGSFAGMKTALVAIGDTLSANNLEAIDRFYRRHKADFVQKRLPKVLDPSSRHFDTLTDQAFFIMEARIFDIWESRKQDFCRYAAKHCHELIEFPGTPVYDWQQPANTSQYELLLLQSRRPGVENVRDLFYEPETDYLELNNEQKLRFEQFLADPANYTPVEKLDAPPAQFYTIGLVVMQGEGTTGLMTIAGEFKGFRIQPSLNGYEYYELTEKGVSALVRATFPD